jgi:hypothetical protein
MAPRPSADSQAALGFVLGGGSYEDALRKWPSVNYSNLWKRAQAAMRRPAAAVAKPKKQKLQKKGNRAAATGIGRCRRTSKQAGSHFAATKAARVKAAAELKAAVKEGARLVKEESMGKKAAAAKVSSRPTSA